MARKKRKSSRRRRGGGAAQRQRFATAAKAAMSQCIVSAGERGGSSDTVRKNYGRCMRSQMKARL